MRHAVKKPGVSKAAPFSGLSTPLDVSTTRIASPQVIQTQRNKKAETTAQSPLISRFGQTAMPSVSKKTVHLPVTPAPSHASVHTASVKKTVAAPHDASAQAKAQAQSQSQSQKNIASALDKASSHTHGKLKATKRRHKAAHKLGVSPRFLSGAAATMAIVLLVGFFAYQNVPSIAVRMAASKAGFSAKLPGYQPSGFAMSGPVQAGPGIVTISFASNSDDRSFQLSQRPSEWNSESLLNQFVAQKNTPYRTVQEAGKTIYMYNESSATWVSGGVWYQIDGESDLSSEQLLRIANSI